jgi:hypothetical protein
VYYRSLFSLLVLKHCGTQSCCVLVLVLTPSYPNPRLCAPSIIAPFLHELLSDYPGLCDELPPIIDNMLDGNAILLGTSSTNSSIITSIAIIIIAAALYSPPHPPFLRPPGDLDNDALRLALKRIFVRLDLAPFDGSFAFRVEKEVP